MRWVPPPGVLGVATGAIAIGITATSTSTTTTILTATIISIRTILTAITLTEGKAARVSGSTTRNIAEMHRMVIEEPRTSLAAMRVSSRAGAVELEVGVAPVVRVALVVLVVQAVRAVLAGQADQEAPVVLVAQVAQVVPAVLVVQVGRAVLAGQADQEAPVVLVAQVELAELVSQAALAVLAIVPALEPVIVQVAELETVPVEAPAKIKSVIAVRHRAQVLGPKREADMAVVVAATTRAPAATEAARAWVAAVTAVVVVAE